MGVSTSSAKSASPLAAWLFSSIGKKTVVAVTGIFLVLFVFGHLLGNLTFFLGPDIINSYAKHLRDLGPFLWVIRGGLLIILVLHIYFTISLWAENQAARPEKYAVKNHVKATVFSRTMRLSGLIVFAFVIFHILHYTARTINPAFQHYETDLHGVMVHDVYKMMVVGFSVPWVSAIYILSLGLLAFHLSHGIASLFQTLGLSNKQLRPRFEFAGRALAWALFLGFTSIPVAVLLGVGKEALK